jgi:hypothetical protein
MNQEEWRAAWRRRDKRDRKKVNQRWVDRWWFKKMLPKAMYDKYEVCHDWENEAVCTLLTPFIHRGALRKGNIKK